MYVEVLYGVPFHDAARDRISDAEMVPLIEEAGLTVAGATAACGAAALRLWYVRADRRVRGDVSPVGRAQLEARLCEPGTAAP